MDSETLKQLEEIDKWSKERDEQIIQNYKDVIFMMWVLDNTIED